MPTTSAPFNSTRHLGADFLRVDTSAEHTVGSVAVDQLGNSYMYVFADTEALTVDSLVTIDSAGVATLADASGNRADGVTIVAIALDSYGWVGIRGDFDNVSVAAGVAANEYVTWAVNGSGQLQEVPGTYSASNPGVRGVVLSAPVSNKAIVRFN